LCNRLKDALRLRRELTHLPLTERAIAPVESLVA
jgi:hypothetical protein